MKKPNATLRAESLFAHLVNQPESSSTEITDPDKEDSQRSVVDQILENARKAKADKANAEALIEHANADDKRRKEEGSPKSYIDKIIQSGFKG
jgi:hypothetical protein